MSIFDDGPTNAAYEIFALGILFLCVALFVIAWFPIAIIIRAAEKPAKKAVQPT